MRIKLGPQEGVNLIAAAAEKFGLVPTGYRVKNVQATGAGVTLTLERVPTDRGGNK